jgi:DNA modification methylase
MRKLEIIDQNVDALRPYARNARTHSKKQIRQIAESIRKFGFTNPVLVDAANGIIAGHGRVEAAKLLGITQVPTVALTGMTPAEVRAYIIADNKIAENAGWDKELLAIELRELSVDLEFDPQVLGFETAEIDILFGAPETKDDPGDKVPEIDRSMPATTRRGDIWTIGRHRLLCGDATNADDYRRLLAGTFAQMVFTDPPYNVPIAGHVSGLGKATHREFEMASGEMTPEEFTQFLGTTCENLQNFSTDGSLHFICMDWRHMRELLDATSAYTEHKNLCVWAKTNAGMGSLYRSQHELVFVFKKGTAPHINNVELGRYGRNRTNLWTYAGANSFGESRDADLAMHPTVKPVQLVADAILDCSDRNGVILDPFCGSGTTLVAAERTGRMGYGIEIDPLYCDLIVRRLQDICGTPGRLEHSGHSFANIAAARSERQWCASNENVAVERAA